MGIVRFQPAAEVRSDDGRHLHPARSGRRASNSKADGHRLVAPFPAATEGDERNFPECWQSVFPTAKEY